MSKQVLDAQQMQHLQELGLDTSNASMLYCNLYDEEYILVERKHRFDKEENAIVLDGVRDSVIYCKKVTPVYTLQNVLDSLPKEITQSTKRYWLQIYPACSCINYCYEDFNFIEFKKRVFWHDGENGLIDAAYEMLVWCIENKFVETNKTNEV